MACLVRYCYNGEYRVLLLEDETKLTSNRRQVNRTTSENAVDRRARPALPRARRSATQKTYQQGNRQLRNRMPRRRNADARASL
jgi:hypothetical protein